MGKHNRASLIFKKHVHVTREGSNIVTLCVIESVIFFYNVNQENLNPRY